MKNVLMFVVCLCATTMLAAQINTDSLWKLWNATTQVDTVRLYGIDELAWDTRNVNPDSAIVLAKMEFDFADKKNLAEWKAKACNTIGVAYYIKSDYPKAIEWHKKCYGIWEAMNDLPGMGSSLNNLGNVYSDLGDYAASLDSYQKGLGLEQSKSHPLTGNYHMNIGLIYLNRGSFPIALMQFQQALAAFEKEGDKQGMGMADINIGILYDDMDNETTALDYYNKSIVLNTSLGDKRGLADAYANIGIIHKKHAEYDQALLYEQKSLALEKELGDEQSIASIAGTIGDIYSDQNDFPRALENFKLMLNLSGKLGIKAQVAAASISTSNVYLKQKDYLSADTWAKKGLQLSENIGMVVLQRDASRLLYEINKAMGKGNEALRYHEKFLVLSDSLQVTETNKKLDQMEFAKVILADSMKQEQAKVRVEMAHQTEVHHKNQQRNAALYTGIGVLLIAAGLWSRLHYVRKSRAVLRTEKDRSENLLLNILPAEIAEELKINGKAEARDFDMVSILFTDFKGFTGMSERMSAKDLVAEINFCFEAFDGIAGKYRVEKIKTIGDSYMAAGGLPVPTNESVKNTVLAALEMQLFIEKRRVEKDAAGLLSFQMRIGIHTGPVVAGIVGIKKFQYDIWGDTVNTASRMESSGAVGAVNISQATYEMVKDEPRFNFESRGMVEAKGKGMIGMYFVSLRP